MIAPIVRDPARKPSATTERPTASVPSARPVPGRNRPYDVVLVCNYSPWSRYKGGGQKSVHMVASAMAQSGRRVAVVYSKSPWERVDMPDGLPYTVVWAFFVGVRPGISSPLRFLNGIPFFFKVRSLCGPETLIIGNGDESSLLGFIRRKGAFVFASRNTYPDYLYGRDWTRPLTWLRALFREPRDAAVALALRGADRVTCTSGFSLEQVLRCFGIPKARVAVIPNGIDPVFLSRKAVGGGTGVLFFGRLTGNKGARLALEVYLRLPAEVRREHPLLIVGEGPQEGILRKRVRESDAQEEVRFLGWLDGEALTRMIAACKAVLLPSQEESFGNAILEALIMGQRLVTTRVCAIPELVGGFASLAAPDDEEEMAGQLLRELGRPRSQEEVDAQAEYFRERYSWGVTARRYLELSNP